MTEKRRLSGTKLGPEAEPEPEVGNLCDTCLYAYPHCGGDLAQGFITKNGIIIGCTQYRKVEGGPVEPPAVETEPEPEAEPKVKPIPERLKRKREIQAKLKQESVPKWP